MASHILVYMVAWAFLSNSEGINMKLIGPADSWRFLVSMIRYFIKTSWYYQKKCCLNLYGPIKRPLTVN